MTEVLCYFCHARAILTGDQGQRCRRCDVVLNPAPTWVTELGWPKRPTPSCHRSRLPYHSPTPIKRIQFHGNENRLLARRLEFLAQSRGIRINDLLLVLVRRGLEAESKEAKP